MIKRTLLFIITGATALLSQADRMDSRWGVASHPVRKGWEYEMHEKMFDGIRECGINNLRVDMDWPAINPKPGIYNFSMYDEVIWAAKSRGLSWLGIMTGGLWGKENAYNCRKRWLDYLEATSMRYSGNVEEWEVINEADWGSWRRLFNNDFEKLGAEYGKLLKDAYPAIKKGNPNVRVLFTGIADMYSKFIEAAFKQGIENSFDAMNVHRYYGPQAPELDFTAAFENVRNLMKKYGIDKPVWVTETGSNTAPLQPATVAGIPLALKKLGIDPDAGELAIFEDRPENYFTNYMYDYTGYMFPNAKDFIRIRLSDIERLDAQKAKAILLPADGTFPRKYLGALRKYLSKGGTVVIPAQVPFKNEFVQSKENIFNLKYGNTNELKNFRLGVATGGGSLPKKFSSGYEPGEEFPELSPSGVYSSTYLTTDNLGPKDKFIPIFCAVHNGKKYPLGGIYKLGGDLNGNIITFPGPINSGGSENYQAKLLPRYMITILSCGVEKIFTYSYHSNARESDSEGHFGITRYDLSPKPAWRAYKNIIEMLGEKSVPVLKRDNEICLANWTRDDGKNVFAIWSLNEYKQTKVDVSIEGKILEMKNHVGGNVNIPSGNNFTMNLTSAMTFIVGPENIYYKRK